MRDLGPQSIDHPRRITETLTAGRMPIWGTNSFQAVVICINAPKGHPPKFLLNFFPKAQIGKHIKLSDFEERYEPGLGIMLGRLTQREALQRGD